MNDTDPILPGIAIGPLVGLIVIFVLSAIYYCVKVELENRRKIGASKSKLQDDDTTIVVKKISGTYMTFNISVGHL